VKNYHSSRRRDSPGWNRPRCLFTCRKIHHPAKDKGIESVAVLPFENKGRVLEELRLSGSCGGNARRHYEINAFDA
jgi:hypothetical protein